MNGRRCQFLGLTFIHHFLNVILFSKNICLSFKLDEYYHSVRGCMLIINCRIAHTIYWITQSHVANIWDPSYMAVNKYFFCSSVVLIFLGEITVTLDMFYQTYNTLLSYFWPYGRMAWLQWSAGKLLFAFMVGWCLCFLKTVQVVHWGMLDTRQ